MSPLHNYCYKELKEERSNLGRSEICRIKNGTDEKIELRCLFRGRDHDGKFNLSVSVEIEAHGIHSIVTEKEFQKHPITRLDSEYRQDCEIYEIGQLTLRQPVNNQLSDPSSDPEYPETYLPNAIVILKA